MTPTLKTVRRRTISPHRGRRIVVSIGPGDVIGLRHERTRRTEYLTVAACFDLAVKLRVAAAKRDKAAKGRKNAR